MIGSTSSYWKWKDGPMVACVAGGLGRVATKGREAGSFAKSLPAPLHFSLFCSFSVSPLPKSNMAPKQTFHRIHEDRQLRRLLQVFARVNWAFVSQSSPCWVFFLAASKELSLALVRFLCFFIHFIHSGTFS